MSYRKVRLKKDAFPELKTKDERKLRQVELALLRSALIYGPRGMKEEDIMDALAWIDSLFEEE